MRKASDIQWAIYHRSSWSGFSDKTLGDYPGGEFSIRANGVPQNKEEHYQLPCKSQTSQQLLLVAVSVTSTLILLNQTGLGIIWLQRREPIGISWNLLGFTVRIQGFDRQLPDTEIGNEGSLGHSGWIWDAGIPSFPCFSWASGSPFLCFSLCLLCLLLLCLSTYSSAHFPRLGST